MAFRFRVIATRLRHGAEVGVASRHPDVVASPGEARKRLSVPEPGLVSLALQLGRLGAPVGPVRPARGFCGQPRHSVSDKLGFSREFAKRVKPRPDGVGRQLSVVQIPGTDQVVMSLNQVVDVALALALPRRDPPLPILSRAPVRTQ